MVWGIMFWQTLGLLVPTEHQANQQPDSVLVLTTATPFWTQCARLLIAASIMEASLSSSSLKRINKSLIKIVLSGY